MLGFAYVIAAPPSSDLAAAAYRSDLFSRAGFTLWDNSWYDGHHLPAYSVLAPALGAWIGLQLLAALSAVAATALFALLIDGRFPARATRIAAVWFALGVSVELLSNRIPFDLGGVAIEGLVHVEDLANPQLLRLRARLQLHTDYLVHLVPVGPRIQAEQPTVPESGARSPIAHSTVVVLPAPFGPRIPKISPGATVNEMSSTATRFPYVLRRLAISTAYWLSGRTGADRRPGYSRRRPGSGSGCGQPARPWWPKYSLLPPSAADPLPRPASVRRSGGLCCP